MRAKLQEELATLTGGKAPADFVRVIQTIFDLKQQGELADAGALISWLSGSSNVAASGQEAAPTSRATSAARDALAYLRGILEIVKAAGYKGLLIVIDEAETILRMRTDSRHKSLNGIRQISDAVGRLPGPPVDVHRHARLLRQPARASPAWRRCTTASGSSSRAASPACASRSSS